MSKNTQKSFKKNIKFEFYQIFKKDSTGKESLFELLYWIKSMKTLKIEDRLASYGIDQIRLNQETYDKNNNIFILNFSRLRESMYPSVVNISNLSSKDVTISNDEFLSEDISAIYDPVNSILMIQRNINSLSPSAVEEYVSAFWSAYFNHSEIIDFRPIIDQNPFETALDKKEYRSLNIKTADYKYISNSSNSILKPFAQAFDSLKVYNSVDIEIKLSMGRKRSQNLDYKETQKVIKELEKNRQNFNKIEVRGKSANDTKFEKVDLLSNKLYCEQTFNIPSRSSFKSSTIQKEMINLYFNGTEPMKQKVIDNI